MKSKSKILISLVLSNLLFVQIATADKKKIPAYLTTGTGVIIGGAGALSFFSPADSGMLTAGAIYLVFGGGTVLAGGIVLVLELLISHKMPIALVKEDAAAYLANSAEGEESITQLLKESLAIVREEVQNKYGKEQAEALTDQKIIDSLAQLPNK